MKILHVISSMSQEAGGPPGICAGIAGAQAARGDEITIATVDDIEQRPGGATRVKISPAIQLVEFPLDGNLAYCSSSGLDAYLRDHAAQFNMLHLHSVWQFPTFSAARAAQAAHVPYVVLLNGMLEEYSVRHRSYWKKRLYWLARERRVMVGAKGLHCSAPEIRKAISWIARMPKFVVGNGIAAADLENLPLKGRFRAAHPEIGGNPFALFLSRLHPKKGLDRLIPAWKHFAQALPNARFAIAGAGDPDYVASLDRLIASNGLSDKVLRVGQLTGPAKWEALVDADVFVLPSHQEGFSMAITEALAARCPVVVTEECNFDELGPAGAGVIIKGGDMAAFVKAAAGLVADPTSRQRMAERGRRLVEESYTWEKIAGQLDRVYQHILAGKTLPADGREVW